MPLTNHTAAPPAPSRLALPAILLAQFVTPLAIAGVAVALPSISHDLGSNPLLLQGAVNAFNIAFAISTVLWGTLSDRIGHTKTFVVGITAALASSLGSALSPHLWLLDTFRVIAGIGAAAVITSATAMISLAFTGRRRTFAFAAFGTVNGLGLAAGPTLSGLALSITDWRGIFFLHALLLAIAAAGCRHLPRLTHLAAAPRTEPSHKVRTLLHPGYLAMALIPIAGAAGFVTLLTYFPTALQAVQGASAGTSGLMMLAMTAPVLLSPMLIHRLLVDAAPSRAVAVCVVALVCLVAAPLGLLSFGPDTPAPVVLGLFVVAGLGFGLPLGIVDGTALGYIPPEQQGTAAGVLNLLRLGSEALFVAMYATVLTTLIGRSPDAKGRADEIAAGQPGGADIYTNALHPVMLGIAVICAGLLVAFVVLIRHAEAR